MVESSDARRPDVPEVVVAVLRDQDRVLLCHRSPGRRWYPNVWDLPGGHVEPGERPAAALVRELAEELGIRVREPSPEPAARIRADDFDLRIWVLDTWAGPVRNLAPDEHDDLAWVDLDGLASRSMAHPQYLALLAAVLRGEVPAVS
jgi:8-oxo-dGTP diphosphatase